MCKHDSTYWTVASFEKKNVWAAKCLWFLCATIFEMLIERYCQWQSESSSVEIDKTSLDFQIKVGNKVACNIILF